MKSLGFMVSGIGVGMVITPAMALSDFNPRNVMIAGITMMLGGLIAAAVFHR